MKYENIVRKLRFCTDYDYWDSCEGCEYDGMEKGTCLDVLMNEAADAIEELTRVSDRIYPLTITRDRYRGTYSGGRFTAWNCHPDEIPEEISLDDVSCYKWWHSSGAKLVGRGNSPLEAVSDLYRLILHTGDKSEEEDNV